MAASLFTIYMLDNDSDFEQTIDDIVENFNSNCEEEDKKFNLKNNRKFHFENIQDFKLYMRAAETEPDWSKVLVDLVTTNLNDVKNINHSYVLFIKVNEIFFAVTGGSGHHLIDSSKKYNFGLELLSRIVNEDDNYIKSVADRHFTGKKLGGGTQYIGNVTINSERDFNNMFKEIQLALPKSVIEEKLGINIKVNKQDYRLFAKDSIKFSKAITLNELDRLLFSVSKLMDIIPPYSILPFYQINKKASIITELNNVMIEDFINYLNGVQQPNDFMILPFYQTCDKHYFKIRTGRDSLDEYTDLEELLNHFKNNVNTNMEKEDILESTKKIKLIGKVENETVIESTLFKHIDSKIIHNATNYWLTEGNWYLFEREFIENINNTFTQKVTKSYDLNFKLNNLQVWESGKEGDFNFSHISTPNTFVLDKILVNKIELCDLLIEEGDKLYFVHVKDGLDGDVRVLSNQIVHSMETVSEGINFKGTTLIKYYQSIKNKIKDHSEEDLESSISISARKFIDRFESQENFVNFIKEKKKDIVFVFAFRPKAIHDLYNPSSITSTAAKLSMITLTNTVNDYDFQLEFMQIERHNETTNKLSTDKLIIP